MTSTSTNHWLPIPDPKPDAHLRLFCFPYAGGAARIFNAWSDQIPETMELCPVELPGHGRRLAEKPYARLSPLVEAIAIAINPFLDKPFAFFGHSMGALLAFELAQHLREYNAPQPVHLFVSGCRAPQFPDTDSPSRNLPDEELMKKLRWLKGTPREVLDNPEMRQLLFPVLRADFAVCEMYEYRSQPPLDCPITALGGWRDPATRSGGLRGWRQHTTETFAKKVFRGNHFFLHSSQTPLLKFLCKQLSLGENLPT
ncbi:MAG: putative thioesterase [Cyanobacteria bacterium QH_6_48_35]|nr:MAG: putative thioesterase [Cyanobacteria bacterium QH_6_48_35]PSO74790.1 MAG: putative thioesterase [Cyanobacteria bacterium QH_3_48_40]PSO79198.1 MAG: putative thioesterase [Cyanobacteria bacterium QH_9_48_43]PSO86989.1 MAG: putative thioesterase [Cyanobacteria bacterium QS_5_48_63]PSP07090.1 MAG: putative thioesterase [Cyanobacteria bacterium SW_12_48_29]